jgi:poly-beta-1,6-N-acetyl-D-glucosamine N-deacetylase
MTRIIKRVAGVVAVSAALVLLGCPPETAIPPASREFISTRDLASPNNTIAETGAPAPAPAGAPERVMGFQVLLFSSKTESGLDGEMKRIAATGADTVIVRVFHNKDDRFYPFVTPRTDCGVYFETGRAPVVADALSPMIRAARKNGLNIWAWMTTRYTAWGADRYRLRAYDFSKKTIVPAFGRDLFDDREVADLVGLYQDLAVYDIDGILFQDDLVLKHNEGVGESAERLFGSPIRPETFYVDPYRSPDGNKYYAREYTDRFWEWSRFKASRLADVEQAIVEGTREVRPGLKFAVNLSYESVTRPDMALAWLSQDINRFLSNGTDYVFIMAYHRQIMKEKGLSDPGQAGGLLAEIASRAVPAVGEPSRIGIKLQVMDWETGRPIPPEELKRTASYLGRTDTISLIVVPYVQDAPFTEIRGIFRTALGKKQ